MADPNFFKSPFSKRTLTRTAEYERIFALPRREWSDEDSAALAKEMTLVLKTYSGTQQLRPIQAVALYELGTHHGMFGPIRVGGGKTLLSLLAPYVLEAKRPMLLLPASLIAKTDRERRELAKHWRVASNLRLYSYEMLGRVRSAQELEFMKPDLIIADECHRLKNKRAGVTRRVTRYMKAHPDTKFVGISGTVMKRSLHDFAHIIHWCLKESTPLPSTEGELELWCDALDERVNPLARVNPGPLGGDLQTARRTFQKRLLETPGVVASKNSDGCTASLNIRAILYDTNEVTERNFHTLREAWATPDGWTFSEAVMLWGYARQLALGLHYVWDPRPPDAWMTARAEWHSFVRGVLARSRTVDTEKQVALLCAKEQLPVQKYLPWRNIRESFTPNPRDVWHDSSALTVCASWMLEGAGIVWTDHSFFAKELSRRTGASYYGRQGEDEKGNKIEDADPKKAIIASIPANSTGRNLQAFNRNLITAISGGSAQLEQLLGRTHRDGQTADEVQVDILLGCFEHHDSFRRALSGAQATADTLGHDQKLLIATIDWPADQEIKVLPGARWLSNK